MVLHVYARNDPAREIMHCEVSPAFVLRLIKHCELIEPGAGKPAVDLECEAEEAGVWRIQSHPRKHFTSVRIFGSGDHLHMLRDVEYFYCSLSPEA